MYKHKILSWTAWMILALLFISCNKFEVDDDDRNIIIPLTKSEEAIRDVTTDYSLRLFDQIVTADNRNNVFFSPLCLTMLNAMLANGAKGETFQEIVETMGFSKDQQLNELNSYFATMVSAMSRADRSVDFSLANSMWLAHGFSTKNTFTNQLKSVYKADLYVVDFSRQSTISQINKWCSKKTSGMISELVSKLDDQTLMMLVDALYFQGEWKMKFKAEDNTEGSFTRLDGTTDPAVFMSMKTALLKGYADEEVRVVRMPYGNGSFYMEAILPETENFMGFIHNLSFARLSGWDENNTEIIDLKFPKFKESYDTGESIIGSALQKMGMKKAFTSSADFSAISDKPLWVDAILQKTAIVVDEGGTRAAASGLNKMRGADLVTYPKEIKMYFDRPFIYLIREQSTGVILFIGAKVK
ncbi:MAG: serpin family protein [Bacteroidales bacterium]|nr:serpin family protein [Bacteroidales bacterium]